MIIGYWERRVDKDCETIYLIDREQKLSYRFQITVTKTELGTYHEGTDFDSQDGLGIMKALAEALQMGGYIPKAATDAELSATKYHLEDLRKLAIK